MRFYATKDLRGPAALALNGEGFTDGQKAICVWRPNAFDARSPHESTVLVLPSSAAGACSDDLPLRSFSGDPRWVFVELVQLEGFVGTIAYKGTHYYFDLRPIVGPRWERPWLVDWPQASPPLAGGVDIPRISRPANRKAPYSIALRRAPSAAARVVTRLTAAPYFEQFNIGNDAMLAAVYGRTRGWSLLRLIDGGTGWISPADSGSSVSAERLALSADGIYDWDWTLASEPGGQQRTAVPRDPRRKWIGYLVERELVAGSVPVFATPDRSSPPVAEWDPAGDMRLAYVRPDGTIRAPRSLV